MLWDLKARKSFQEQKCLFMEMTVLREVRPRRQKSFKQE